MKEAEVYKYFTIVEHPPKAGRKTATYEIRSHSQQVTLGWIKWYGAWRRFCFMPEPQTTWSKDCLYGVSSFIFTLMKNRKRERALLPKETT